MQQYHSILKYTVYSLSLLIYHRPDSTSGKTFASGAGWDSNPEPIKSPTHCQRLATAATLFLWALAQSRGDGHCSLVTPERVLGEYNEDLIFFLFSTNLSFKI